MMIRTSIAFTCLLIVCLFDPLLARPRFAADLPDLKIRQYEFDSYNDKRLRVQVANDGKAASRPCRLELTIRKINGSAVNRTASETIPFIEPGKEEWITLNTSGILQAAYSLKDTTFRLIADDAGIVAESNEDNNETWHNSN
jgi:subtilase family serine protease